MKILHKLCWDSFGFGPSPTPRLQMICMDQHSLCIKFLHKFLHENVSPFWIPESERLTFMRTLPMTFHLTEEWKWHLPPPLFHCWFSLWQPCWCFLFIGCFLVTLSRWLKCFHLVQYHIYIQNFWDSRRSSIFILLFGCKYEAARKHTYGSFLPLQNSNGGEGDKISGLETYIL